jgi:serine O-acetyltransferase
MNVIEPAVSNIALSARIWEEARRDAMDTASREPLLSARMRKLLLDRESAPDALAAVLASRLASDDLPEAGLHGLLRTILQGPAIWAQAAADMDAVRTRDPACPGYLHVLLNLKGFHALQTHRAAHRLWAQDRKELAYVLASAASLAFAVDIHPAAAIGSGVMLDHATGIVIGETARIGNDVSILQNVTLGGTGKEHGDRHPKIGDGVMIGAGATVLGNITVGAMSKVAAGSVVLKDVPPHCTVAGVPARVVREHEGNLVPSVEMNQLF